MLTVPFCGGGGGLDELELPDEQPMEKISKAAENAPKTTRER